MNNNSVMTIYPYLHKGTWVFDDEDRGLQREPFIAGIDTMLSNPEKKVPAIDVVNFFKLYHN